MPSLKWIVCFLALGCECDFPILETVYTFIPPADLSAVLRQLPEDVNFCESIFPLHDALRANKWRIWWINKDHYFMAEGQNSTIHVANFWFEEDVRLLYWRFAWGQHSSPFAEYRVIVGGRKLTENIEKQGNHVQILLQCRQRWLDLRGNQKIKSP